MPFVLEYHRSHEIKYWITLCPPKELATLLIVSFISNRIQSIRFWYDSIRFWFDSIRFTHITHQIVVGFCCTGQWKLNNLILDLANDRQLILDIISGSTIVGFGLQSVLLKLIQIHFTCQVLIFTGTGRWKCEEKYKSTKWFWI